MAVQNVSGQMASAPENEILQRCCHHNRRPNNSLKFIKVNTVQKSFYFIKNTPTTAQKWWLKVVNSGWQHINLHSTFDCIRVQPASQVSGSHKTLKSHKTLNYYIYSPFWKVQHLGSSKAMANFEMAAREVVRVLVE